MMGNKLRVQIVMVFVAGGLIHAGTTGSGTPNFMPDSSLYQLSSQWTTDDGHKLRLADLQGKVRLLTLFFGHCQSTCPMVLNRLKSLESKLPKNWGNGAGFVLVTLDPRRDDSGSLAEYRRDASLSKDRWTLLRGASEDTRELAMLMGVAYVPSTKNGGIEHNVAMVLLDRKGKVLRKDSNLDDEAGQLKALRKAIADFGN